MIYYDIQHHGNLQPLSFLLEHIDHSEVSINVSYDGDEEAVHQIAAWKDLKGISASYDVRRSIPITWCGPSQIIAMRDMLHRAVKKKALSALSVGPSCNSR